MRHRIQSGVRPAVFTILSLMLLTAAHDSFSAQVVPRTRGGDFLRHITLFNRQGLVLRTLGDVGFYEQPAFSPDGTRLAVVKRDTGSPPRRHIWVFDISTGESHQVTFDAAGESQPIWSPDGRYIAFASRRTTATGFYRRASDGTGSDELLYQHPQRGQVNLRDWSADGRFLSIDSGGVLYVLPLFGDRRVIELIRDQYEACLGRFSPNSRFLAYSADESGRSEVYVHAFEPSVGRLASPGAKWQVSGRSDDQSPRTLDAVEAESCYGGNGIGPVYWRQDGRELYYLTLQGALMAAEVGGTPDIARPGVLFQISGTSTMVSVNGDGQRIAVTVPVRTVRTIVTVSPTLLTEYTGTYEDDSGERLFFTLERNQLIVRPDGGLKCPLLAESETYFYCRQPGGDRDYEFSKDRTGRMILIYPSGRTRR